MNEMLKVNYETAYKPQQIELHPDTHEWDVVNGHGIWWRIINGVTWHFIPLPRIYWMEKYLLNSSGNIIRV